MLMQDFIIFNGRIIFYCMCRSYTVVVQSLSSVQLFCDPMDCSCQAPLSVGFPRQEYWSRLPYPCPGDLLDLRFNPVSPALASRFFTTKPPGKSSSVRPGIYPSMFSMFVELYKHRYDK